MDKKGDGDTMSTRWGDESDRSDHHDAEQPQPPPETTATSEAPPLSRKKLAVSTGLLL